MNWLQRNGLIGAKGEAPAFDAVQAAPFGSVGIRIDGDRLSELVFLPPVRVSAAVGGEGQRKSASPRNALADEACRQIKAFIADPDFAFDLPLAHRGTPFQRRVWDAIVAIPRGRTRAYGELARDVGSAPRAVGQACGANFFPLVIPCHRVVAASGMGGFAHHDSGFHLRVKRWLLAHETD